MVKSIWNPNLSFLQWLAFIFHIQSHVSCFTIEGQMGLQELGHSRVTTFLASEPKRWEIPKPLSHFATQDLPTRPIKTCLHLLGSCPRSPNNFQNIWLTLENPSETIKHWPWYQHVSTALLGFPRWWRLVQCCFTSSRQGRRRDSQAGHQCGGQEFHGIQWFRKIKSNPKTNLVCMWWSSTLP